jgi:hypothetical protein
MEKRLNEKGIVILTREETVIEFLCRKRQNKRSE